MWSIKQINRSLTPSQKTLTWPSPTININSTDRVLIPEAPDAATRNLWSENVCRAVETLFHRTAPGQG